MVKRKIVIKINVKCDRCRSKALKIASTMDGKRISPCWVESIAIVDRDRVVVVGEGVDAAELTRALRKTMGYAEIIGVGRMKPGLAESEEPWFQFEETGKYHHIPPMHYNGASGCAAYRPNASYPSDCSYDYPAAPRFAYNVWDDPNPGFCSIM